MPGSPDNSHPQALTAAPLDQVAAEVAHYIRKLRPQVVITFDPIGGYRHPDHIAIQRATVKAFDAAGQADVYPDPEGLPPYTPQKLYFNTFSRTFLRVAIAAMRLVGRDPHHFGVNGDSTWLRLWKSASRSMPASVTSRWLPSGTKLPPATSARAAGKWDAACRAGSRAASGATTPTCALTRSRRKAKDRKETCLRGFDKKPKINQPMEIIQRPFLSEADKFQMAALARRLAGDTLHVIDLPYRLNSWAFDDPSNIGLWFDGLQQLAAWAVLQTPFWTIDYVFDPFAEINLHTDILAWADFRARATIDTPNGHPAWYVNVFRGQAERIGDLEKAGFKCQSDVGEDSWSKVLMQRSIQTPVKVYRPL